ncbi:phage tail protein [Marinicellulosiphila megalodicopiae]|uniref:phage tail protein n=1 Tax=Marinicellulosiphila megalodicopiae TaxID=2724896 RepID=UPI003BB14689
MNIKLTSNIKSVEKTLSEIEKKVFTPSLNASINRTGANVKKKSVSQVAKVKRVKLALINKRGLVRKSNFRRLDYSVTFYNRDVSWIELGAKRVGVTKKNQLGRGVKAGKRYQSKAFFAKGKGGNTQVFMRKTRSRNPLIALKVPLNKVFNNAWQKHQSSTESIDFFDRSMQREIEYRSNKIIAKQKQL